jgi:hypothetical protein
LWSLQVDVLKVDWDAVARWRYKSRYSGEMEYNANDSRSWRAVLVDGSRAVVNLSKWLEAHDDQIRKEYRLGRFGNLILCDARCHADSWWVCHKT